MSPARYGIVGLFTTFVVHPVSSIHIERTYKV